MLIGTTFTLSLPKKIKFDRHNQQMIEAIIKYKMYLLLPKEYV